MKYRMLDEPVTWGALLTIWSWACFGIVVFLVALAIVARVKGWWVD